MNKPPVSRPLVLGVLGRRGFIKAGASGFAGMATLQSAAVAAADAPM